MEVQIFFLKTSGLLRLYGYGWQPLPEKFSAAVGKALRGAAVLWLFGVVFLLCCRVKLVGGAMGGRRSAAGATCGGPRGTSARGGWASRRRVSLRRGARTPTPSASPPRRKRRWRAGSGAGSGTRRRSGQGAGFRLANISDDMWSQGNCIVTHTCVSIWP